MEKDIISGRDYQRCVKMVEKYVTKLNRGGCPAYAMIAVKNDTFKHFGHRTIIHSVKTAKIGELLLRPRPDESVNIEAAEVDANDRYTCIYMYK